MNNINQGDTLQLEYNFANYSAVDYDIWIALRGPSEIDIKSGETGITITTNGDSFIINVPASETNSWDPGEYWYSIYTGGYS